MMSAMMEQKLLGLAAILCLCAACTDNPISSSGPSAPVSLRANIGTFGCDIAYDAITQTDEGELAPYGVEARTDTAHICEQWTGTDYNAEITQIGSSEPSSDYSEDVKTVIYQSGQTTAYDTYGSPVEVAAGVGSDSFEFVAATPDEKQASIDDPYYAVMGDPTPTHCSNPPCAVMDRQVADVAIVGVRAPIQRPGLKRLVRNKTEIGLSPEGYRQFRGVTSSGEETTISIDPVTELIKRIATKTALGTGRADLTWSLQKGKFVRERMDLASDESIRDRTVQSRTSVTLRNFTVNPRSVR